eukprot:c22350_g1_i2 orf=204-950(-)
MRHFEEPPRRKLRVLCLHGFRTSGAILEMQIRKWDSSVLDLLDLTFLDAPFPCNGKSDVEGIFSPPYYEWFQFNMIFTEYTGMEECITYISNYMDKHGPFDGLLGFSQGAVLSAALVGLQQKGLALMGHPPVHFVIIISGSLLKNKEFMKNCYSENIRCPSVHFIGAYDWLKPRNEELLKVFDNPLVIRHGAKHTVPRLEESVSTLRNFLLSILEESYGEQEFGKIEAASKEDQIVEMAREVEVAASG